MLILQRVYLTYTFLVINLRGKYAITPIHPRIV